MSPLTQFLVREVSSFKILGSNIALLNSSIPMLVSSAVLGLLFCIKANPLSIKIHSFLRNLVQQTAGEVGLRYINFLYTTFFFVLMGNLLGMIPVLYTYTSNPIAVLAFSAGTIGFVAFVGVREQGLGFFRHFYPKDIVFPIAIVICLIEIVSFLIRPLTLCARLCINMIAGHIMLKIFAGFITRSLLVAPIVIPVIIGMSLFELAVAGLQAYIFTMLACLYLKEAAGH